MEEKEIWTPTIGSTEEWPGRIPASVKKKKKIKKLQNMSDSSHFQPDSIPVWKIENNGRNYSQLRILKYPEQSELDHQHWTRFNNFWPGSEK